MKNNVSIDFVLDEINKNPELLKTKYKFSEGSPLHKFFVYGYCSKFRFKLPTGIPPFKRIRNIPGMNNEYLFSSLVNNKFDIFVNPNIPQKYREQEYIQLLEAIDEKEADILNHVKEQTVIELYPNITYNVLLEAGYLPFSDEDNQRESERLKSKVKSEESTKSDLEARKIDANQTPSPENSTQENDHQSDGRKGKVGNSAERPLRKSNKSTRKVTK